MPLEKLEDIVDALDDLKDAINGRVEIAQSAVLDHEDWTDNGDATGFIASGLTLPAGAIFRSFKAEWDEAPNVAGADGETDLKLEVGTVADPDRCDQATDPDTVLATGLPASFVQDPRNPADPGDGDVVFSAATPIVVKGTLIGGAPDFGNFVAAGGAGKLVLTLIYEKTADL